MLQGLFLGGETLSNFFLLFLLICGLISLICRGVQTFGVSGPHWKKSCRGPHGKYKVTRNY